MKRFHSHGSGDFSIDQFAAFGENIVLENGVMVFHPESITLGNNIYVGHQSILKGYYKSEMIIGEDTWIGQQCFLHSAGGIEIGKGVGIGPGSKILSSSHSDPGREFPIMEGELEFAPVVIGDGADLGVGCVIVPGVHIGKGVQVGAGAVVTRNLPDYCVAVGVPARIIRYRP